MVYGIILSLQSALVITLIQLQQLEIGIAPSFLSNILFILILEFMRFFYVEGQSKQLKKSFGSISVIHQLTKSLTSTGVQKGLLLVS